MYKTTLYFLYFLLSISFVHPTFAKTYITEPRPAYTPPSDQVLYTEIFRLQDQEKWKQADKLILRLDTPLLLGHVYWQRYMHPTGYRANWQELSNWIKSYPNHPGAWQVYHLVKKRKPHNAKMPKAPPEQIWRSANKSKKHNKKPLFVKYKTRKIKKNILHKVKYERPTQALRYITQRDVDYHLSASETDTLKALIARSYYIEGKAQNALKVAIQATRSRQSVPIADWHAGLASWYLGKENQALFHFLQLFNNQNATAHDRSAAAFWASRIHIALKQYAQSTKMLEHATNIGGNRFYALLAHRRLKGNIHFNWQAQKITNTDISAHPSVKRALFLTSINHRERAEWDLLNIYQRLSTEDSYALLNLSRKHHLSAVELALTEKLYENKYNKQIPEGLFPIANYKLNKKYKIDRALIFSIILQESRFKSMAKSYAGARGLMQIMPATAAFVTGDRKLRYKSKYNTLNHSSFNLTIGQQYLAQLFKEKNNNLIYTLGAYNAGPGNMRRWVKELNIANDPLLFIESIPAPETRRYIRSVLRNLWIYREKLNQNIASLEQLSAGSWITYKSIDQ